VETLTAESLKVRDRRTLYVHPQSGAETQVFTISRRDRNRPFTLAEALDVANDPRAKLLVNAQSGRAAVQVPAPSLMLDPPGPVRTVVSPEPATNAWLRSSVNLTTSGDQLGTPLYCAPEQSKDARQADIRSDVYSLGCVLFHALAGQPPFEDHGPIRLVLSHANTPPPRLAGLNIDVPAGLQEALDGMLAKDPALRYPTPGQAARELRRFLPPG